MRANSRLEAALHELSASGIRDVVRSYGGKHLQLRWTVNGGTARMYAVPNTPSDVRSSRNTRADVRRILRADGLLASAETKSPECRSRWIALRCSNTKSPNCSVGSHDWKIGARSYERQTQARPSR
jgi:hypothetical protein